MTKNLHSIQIPQARKAMNGLKAPKEWPQREGKTYHWVLAASAFRNKEPAKEAEQPRMQGNRPESGRWRKEVKALSKKGVTRLKHRRGHHHSPNHTSPSALPSPRCSHPSPSPHQIYILRAGFRLGTPPPEHIPQKMETSQISHLPLSSFHSLCLSLYSLFNRVI